MKIPDIFRKKTDKETDKKLNDKVKNEVSGENKTETICFDKIDYHYEAALKNYCRMYKKGENDLTDEDYLKIKYYAGNHIGFMMAWIIKHNFEGGIHKDEEEVNAVRNEEMSGVEFLINCCDGKFWSEDVSEEILPFVKSYYDSYISEYSSWVINDLCDLPLEFAGTWEDYHDFEHVPDEAYGRYCSGR